VAEDYSYTFSGVVNASAHVTKYTSGKLGRAGILRGRSALNRLEGTESKYSSYFGTAVYSAIFFLKIMI
jgi:hypothetical protein